MQPVDFTTLTATCAELRRGWLPARIEQFYQRDRYTLAIALRTLDKRDWLSICWHSQAAHLCIGDPPPRTPDTFTFSDQLRHQLNGLALTGVVAIAPWERVIDFQFARRPGETPQWHLYAEIMGKYSNLILTDAHRQIVTCAHQVSSQKSSLRPIQTGQPYEPPPPLLNTAPSLEESRDRFSEQVSLVPGQLKKQLLKSYRGLSPVLVESMVRMAGLDPQQTTATLTPKDWQALFERWQEWLHCLEEESFTPAWTTTGYTVMGWEAIAPVKNTQTLLNRYYTNQLNQQTYKQLRHQLQQKVKSLQKKLDQKAQTFATRLAQSDEADTYRGLGDLLMAHLHQWQPGMAEIVLPDFTTGADIMIPLNPEKNAVQNAQALYKQHQKLKRARNAVQPLLAEVQAEQQYLEQIDTALGQIDAYRNPEDLQTLTEIREELIQENYLDGGQRRSRSQDAPETQPHRYQTPSGFELLVGRNNRQNDQLTFRLAGDYDLWFHAQEVAGSHVLLRLEPGSVPDATDLQFAADFATYYSRSRQSDRVPVVYTEPKYVYKPKGAKPGVAIYQREQVIWGQPRQAAIYLQQS
ncbi:MAG: NFACT RNA binding domain-containing protein [Jaaginema sp. PMC 1079.18]|nr:NFACT RNA binding domain-containing protein [Jaaginema sp. PMC 1080.18]MEC4853235.1 NFACT RNA binding domain-containing protein [Jaaginema sp. PMC 1079.18]MEC4867359.1 NFACT RNA binding domain-containing protein [Jaaginema sp. PMC 1078.18]